MTIAFVNGQIMLPAGFRDDVCVVLDGGRICDIAATAPAGARIVDLAGKKLLPGFLDVQVNGGGGRLFNDDPSVDTIAAIAAAHRRFGTTNILPTLISDDLDVVERGTRAVDAAIEAGVPGILGIHIEGPFLSKERHGIHLESKIRALEDRFVDLLTSAKHGRTLVTLAPDNATPTQIERLVAAGVIVSAGHSNAAYEVVQEAFRAGVTGVTHLFNAMSQLVNRAPGMVGAALESDQVYAGIIVDGHHVHPASLRVALRAKGPRRLMLVTDAMPSVGSDQADFLLQGRRIHRDGDMLKDGDGVLAGSTLTMARAVANLVDQTGIALDQAVTMASAVPAEFLGLAGETGSIAIGHRADLIAVTDDFTISESWIGGVPTGIDADSTAIPG